MTEVVALSGSPTESGKKFISKPEKPDQAEYEKNLKAAQEGHDKVRHKLVSYFKLLVLFPFLSAGPFLYLRAK
jgi:hypothetical protein